MKKNYLGLFSRTLVIIILLISFFNNGVNLFAQENDFKIDIDNNGFFETIVEESQHFLQEYSILLDTGDVVHSIYIPTGNNQGLTWDGNYLWCSSISSYIIYQLDHIDGTIINSFPAPGGSNEGLTWDGTYLYACENGGGPGNPDLIYKLDPSDGTVISSIQPESMSWPHGIAWDGQYLWTNNFNPKTITKINPENAQILHTIPAPGQKSVGLTWDGQYLWTDDFEEDLLYKINPDDGTVIYTVASPHTNPRDLAWDGEYLWVLGGGTAYQVDVGHVTTVDENVTDNISLGEIAVFPNPFSKEIKLDYELYTASKITVNIYNQDGKIVNTLLDKFEKIGKQTLSWDGTNSIGKHMPNGMYFCRFLSTDRTHTEKIFLLR